MNKKIIALIAIIVIIIVGVGAYFAFNGSSSSSDTVTIGYLPSDHDAAVLIADAQGKYQKQGLTVELKQFNNGGDLMAAMASGDLDLGYVGITPALSSISKGVPVKVVSAVQNEGSGIVVPINSNIKSIADLKGKKVATPGASSIQYMLLAFALKKNGLTMDDVSVSDLKVAQLVDSIRTNQLDAIVPYEPYVTQSVEEGIGKEIASSDDILPDHPCCVVVAREDYINNHLEDLKKILTIHKETTDQIIANPEAAANELPSDIFDAKVEKEALDNVDFISGLSESYMNNVLKFQGIELGLGLIDKALTKDQIFKVIE
ncbi:MAG: ABC transporter substrate-binding protein [Methanobrevibacter sp.]|jgi:NitT/TauT family transport system substrate-binding protein|nr:ABC transporter substrate-binding protein [Candidatus Methanoflexus mossambicus]